MENVVLFIVTTEMLAFVRNNYHFLVEQTSLSEFPLS